MVLRKDEAEIGNSGQVLLLVLKSGKSLVLNFAIKIQHQASANSKSART